MFILKFRKAIVNSEMLTYSLTCFQWSFFFNLMSIYSHCIFNEYLQSLCIFLFVESEYLMHVSYVDCRVYRLYSCFTHVYYPELQMMWNHYIVGFNWNTNRCNGYQQYSVWRNKCGKSKRNQPLHYYFFTYMFT